MREGKSASHVLIECPADTEFGEQLIFVAVCYGHMDGPACICCGGNLGEKP